MRGPGRLGRSTSATRLIRSEGRFRLEVGFIWLPLPDGTVSLLRTLDLSITIGAQEFPVGASLGSDELMVDGNEWTLEDS